MRVIDVDAHLHEPLDWVEQTDPKLAEALGPPARFMEVADAVFGVSDPTVLGALPTPKSGYDTVLPGFIHHLQMTDTRQPERQADSADDPYCGPEARLAFCDRQ